MNAVLNTSNAYGSTIMIEATIEANPLQINLAGLKSGNEITKTLFIFPEYILFATISTSREMMLDVSSQK